jgi:DNA polymerase-3 subunit delta'
MKAFSGGHKVLILWHAEKMNLSCANKLLKWIEEPNENTSIILITEESSSLLKTIESRCQEIRVGRIKPSDIKSGLIKMGADNIIAKKASLLAEGNFFNALKIIRSLDGNENFEQLFIEWVRTAFVAKSNKKSITRLIQWSDRVSKLGRELEKDFLNYSLEFFRQAVLLNYGGKNLVSLKINDDSFSLEKFSAFIDGTNIEKISEEIERAIFHIERNANGKIVLTDLSIKLTRLLHIKK